MAETIYTDDRPHSREDEGLLSRRVNIEDGEANTSNSSNRGNNDSDEEEYTVSEAVDKINYGAYHYALLLILGGTIMCDGMELTLLAFIQGCVVSDWGISTYYESALASTVFAGQIVGMLTIAPLADIYGRRFIIMMSYFLMVAFAFLSAISPNIWFLLITRAVVGLGIGANQAIAYDLHAELIPAAYRKYSVLLSSFYVTGECLVVVFAWGILEQEGWRWLIFYSAIPLIVFGILCFFFCPESPRLLVLLDRHEEAEKVLQDISNMNGPKMKIKLKRQIIVDVKESSIKELFSYNLCRSTQILWVVWLFSLFTSYSVFLLVINTFESTSDLCSYQYGYILLANSLEYIGVAIAFFFVDSVGRGYLQFYSFNSTGLALLVFALVYTHQYQAFSTTLLFISKISCSVGVFILWLKTAEIYPTEVRATGHSLAVMVGKIGAFAAIYFTDDVTFNHVLIGSLITSFLVAFAATASIALPETSNTALDVRGE